VTAKLADVLAHPEDVAVRRAYGAALADPRGELIATQCDLEDAAVGTARWTELRARQAALLGKHGKAWLAPYKKLLHRMEFRRGMIERVSTPANLATFLADPEAVFGREPVIDVAAHKLTRDTLGWLAATRRLRRLRIGSSKLDFSGKNHALIERLGGLRELELDQVALDGIGDYDSLESVLFGVERLLLAFKTLTLANLDGLLRGMRELRRLALPWMPGLRDLVEQIAWSIQKTKLTHLDLSLNHFDLAALRRFVEAPGFRALRGLGLHQNMLRGREVIDVLGALANLEELDAGNNQLGPEAGAALAAMTQPVRVLRLRQTQLGDAGIVALARGALPALRVLELYNSKFGVEGAQALAAVAWPLEELELSGNKLGDTGVRALAAGTLPKTLRVLKLHSTDLSDAGIAALARASWPALEELELFSDKLGAGTATALAGAAMPCLRRLVLGRMDVPQRPLAPLKKRGVEIDA
jgi:hypothetical protein